MAFDRQSARISWKGGGRVAVELHDFHRHIDADYLTFPSVPWIWDRTPTAIIRGYGRGAIPFAERHPGKPGLWREAVRKLSDRRPASLSELKALTASLPRNRFSARNYPSMPPMCSGSVIASGELGYDAYYTMPFPNGRYMPSSAYASSSSHGFRTESAIRMSSVFVETHLRATGFRAAAGVPIATPAVHSQAIVEEGPSVRSWTTGRRFDGLFRRTWPNGRIELHDRSCDLRDS